MMRDEMKIVQVAMGDKHVLALRANGTVVVWGSNEYGQCDVPDKLVDVVQVNVMANHSLALTVQGQVVAWGRELWTNVGHQTNIFNILEMEIKRIKKVTDDVVQLSVSCDHLLMLKNNGLVEVAVGSEINPFGFMNVDGELFETPSREMELMAEVPAGLNNVVQVAAGWRHSLAVTKQGQVVAWGVNGNGECNMPVGLNNVVQVAAGWRHSLAVTKQGQVVAWGLNGDGECNVPVGLNNVVHVAAGWRYSLAVTKQGQVMAWGWNGDGEYGIAGLNNVVHVADGAGLFISARDGEVLGGVASTKYIGVVPKPKNDSFPKERIENLLPSNRVVEILKLWHGIQIHNFADLFFDNNFLDSNFLDKNWQNHLKSNQAIRQYLIDLLFDSSYGLDIEDFIDTNEFYNLKHIAVSGTHALGLTHQGFVIEYPYWPPMDKWSRDDLRSSLVPLPLAQLHDVIQVAAGDNHSLALKSDGTVVAWGLNDKRQCNVPTALHDVVQVVAGDAYSLAVTRAGKVLGWGEVDPWYVGAPLKSDVIRCLPNISNVHQVVVSDEHALAITKDNRVIAWGNNDNGQCDVPVWLRDVVQVVAGHQCSLALLRSGSIVFWGGNSIAHTERLIQIGTSPHLQYIHPFAAYEGGEAELFSTPSGLLKKYHAPEKTPALAKLQHIIAHSVTIIQADRLLIIWPQKLAYHPFTGELVGYVMPFVAATQLIDALDRTKRLARWPDLATDPRREWQFVLNVARWSAAVLAHIHAHGYVVGDLSPRNILVYEEGTVAFVDCDSYQVGDGSVYGCSVSTAGYRAPEVRQHANGRLQYSVHSDAFALAVAIFRLLSGNLHPYQGITLPSATLTPAQYGATKQQYPHLQPIPDGVDATTYCYERGIWPYDATQQLCVPPVEMQAYYSQLPAAVRGLFGRAFTGAPAQRPTPVEWVQVFDEWLGEVR